jgi:hypothetical protein
MGLVGPVERKAEEPRPSGELGSTPMAGVMLGRDSVFGWARISQAITGRGNAQGVTSGD